MPRRNVLKTYVAEGFYHLYNRGVEKRKIFMDDQDYRVFLSYLKLYLSPPNPSKEEKEHVDLSKEIDLIAYCLMPNHFHLFVQQHNEDGITKLMRLINSRYVTYFNRRHKRVGGLFQSAYKAVLLDSDSQFMHLSRYIHLNPQGLRRKYDLYPYSSYRYFAGQSSPIWLKPSKALDAFSSQQAYIEFVASSINPKSELGRIALD